MRILAFIKDEWAGEMTQWLRALTALPEDQDPIPRPQMAAHNCSGTPTPSHRHTCRQNTNACTHTQRHTETHTKRFGPVRGGVSLGAGLRSQKIGTTPNVLSAACL